MERIVIAAISALILFGCESRLDLDSMGLPLTPETNTPDYVDATCEICDKVFTVLPEDAKKHNRMVCPYCRHDQKLAVAIDRFQSYEHKQAKVLKQIDAELQAQRQAQFERERAVQKQNEEFSNFTVNRQKVENERSQAVQDRFKESTPPVIP